MNVFNARRSRGHAAHSWRGSVLTPSIALAALSLLQPVARAKAEDAIEEITVTARKREERLQDTPISISAFTSTDLEDQGIGRADDIQRFAPNLQFSQSSNGQNSARLQVRGVGTNDPISTRDPGVGVYIDGVYLARAQGQLLGLSDIERIEVLRGPQGTLFGRNTIGGAVNVISKKPTDSFEGKGSVRIGNFDMLETRGSVNIPLVPEKAALRVSFQTQTRDGYTHNELLDNRTDDRQNLGARMVLRVDPTDTLELLFTGEATKSHTSGRGGECRFRQNKLANAPLVANVEIPFFQFDQACLANQADNEFDYRSPVNVHDDLDTWGLSSTITWDLEDITLKSLTAWRRQEPDTRSDYTLAEVNIADVDLGKDQQDQVSQEFNLSGTGLDGRMQWTGGLFGFFEKNNPGMSQQLIGFNGCQLLQSANPCIASFVADSPKTKTNAYAGYGQVTYDLADDLHVTGGLRYSTERKQLRVKQQNFLNSTTFAPEFSPGAQSERFGKWTPLLNLTYDVADDAIVYATYSKGFKSGGFNGRPNAGVPASLLPFDQETLISYEVGTKASFFDNHLITNLSAFVGKYNDIQQTILSSNPANGSFASRVANAGKGTIKGAELEVRAIPTSGLDLRINLGITDAEYDEFDDIINVGGVATPVDRSHESFFNTPSLTGTFSAAYTFYNVAGYGDFTARASWYTQSHVSFGPTSSTLDQGRYGLLSSQISWMLPDGKTEIALFGENLLDRRYLDSGINFEDGFALSVGYYGAPRMYGLEVRRSF